MDDILKIGFGGDEMKLKVKLNGVGNERNRSKTPRLSNDSNRVWFCGG
jgi:hypothetical protein